MNSNLRSVSICLVMLAFAKHAAGEEPNPQAVLRAYFAAIEADPAAAGRFLDDASLLEFRAFHLEVLRAEPRLRRKPGAEPIGLTEILAGASIAEVEKLEPVAFFEWFTRRRNAAMPPMSTERAAILGTVMESPDVAHVVVRWARAFEGEPPERWVDVKTLVRVAGRWLVSTQGTAASELSGSARYEGELQPSCRETPLTRPPSSAAAAASRPRP